MKTITEASSLPKQRKVAANNITQTKGNDRRSMAFTDNRPETQFQADMIHVIKTGSENMNITSTAPVIQGLFPIMRKVKVSITNTRKSKTFNGESGNENITLSTFNNSEVGKHIKTNKFDSLKKTQGISGNRSQYTCAEPHAFSQFVDDDSGETKNLIKDLKESKVSDPKDGSDYKPPCGWCEQWVGGNEGNHTLMKWIRPDPSWLRTHTNW